jgi:hypothetical protein
MRSEGISYTNSENPEDSKQKKLSRTQKLIASLIRRERKIETELTEDTIAAKSAIQYSGFGLPIVLAAQDDDSDD